MYTENWARSASVIMTMCSLRLIILSKLNILFHLKFKNLVTLWKCNSHLQYYKIDLCFGVKLHEINFYSVECEEYKTDYVEGLIHLSDKNKNLYETWHDKIGFWIKLKYVSLLLRFPAESFKLLLLILIKNFDSFLFVSYGTHYRVTGLCIYSWHIYLSEQCLVCGR